MILRELLLLQKLQRVVVVAPPSVVLQWKGEMQSRFGLGFAVMDRAYVTQMRRKRGWGINPWATHTRSKLTRAIRDLAGRFEHKLFLSATPHNGHSNSFSALLEILDPSRFCRGVPVRKQDLI